MKSIGNRGLCPIASKATPVQGVSAMSSCATNALPSVSPSVLPRLSAEMFSAEAKPTAWGVQRPAVSNMPTFSADTVPVRR